MRLKRTQNQRVMEEKHSIAMVKDITRTKWLIHSYFGSEQKVLLHISGLIYEDVKLEIGYRVDLIIENKVILEIKSVDALNDIHLAQILTYLKLSDCKLGMLINFNMVLIKNGIKRVVNNL